jgi:RNA polymerase sigma-70 factor (ECF subfamily)
LDQVLTRLKDEWERSDKGQLFDHLKHALLGERGLAYGLVATELGMTEGAVKVAVHRLRGRYRELLRAEIANTLGDGGDIDEEIRNLFTALGYRKTSQLL